MIFYYLFYFLGCLFFIFGIFAMRFVRKYYKSAYKEIFADIPENTDGEIVMTVKENDNCIKK